MATSFAQILNVLLPIAIIVFFLFVLFKGFGPQLKALFYWFIGLLGYGKEAVVDAVNDNRGYDIIYNR